MVYLVGAGPGDCGLLTCRGKELLQSCDVVIYDQLGTNEVLDLVPSGCKKVYVGKRSGAHSKKQEEINEIIIREAKEHRLVVRLKGGDPFVFGRGGEEAIALKEAGIPFELVPGVTSSIAVPELLGIPVTHRSVSRSFHVYTGHTGQGTEQDLSYIHKQEGTSVFLMGLSHLKEIVYRLLEEGQQKDTPAAVISNGTLPSERIVRGTLENIVQKAEDARMKTPAIIVVGETAGYSFCTGHPGKLAGKKIGLIGTELLRKKLREHLTEDGADCFTLCNMEVVTTKGYEDLKNEAEHLPGYTWIGFTSQNSVRLFFQRLRELRFDYRRLSGIRFAVLGSGTCESLLKEGFTADFIPEEFTAEAFARGLVKLLDQEQGVLHHILIPRAEKGSRKLVQIFEESRHKARILPIYDVVAVGTQNREYLYDFDAIIFASSSGVEGFVEMVGVQNIEEWEKKRQCSRMKVAAIGKMTGDTLKKYGIKTDVIPDQCDVEHMLDALVESFEGRKMK